MAKIAATKSADPDAFMRELDHPLKDVAEAVRKAIRGADKSLVEGVKWNAPSFQHGGDDRITLNLSAKDRIRAARRARQGCCVKCRYDLRGITAEVCPECGAVVTNSPIA